MSRDAFIPIQQAFKLRTVQFTEIESQAGVAFPRDPLDSRDHLGNLVVAFALCRLFERGIPPAAVASV